ncbi:hypothetical protein ACUTFB_25555, partial [Klebsiella pneumoniae]
MDTLFTINACKTFGCRNLGLPSAAEYHFPNFRLGYPALYCAACGSYPPLFNEREFRPWLAAYLTDHARRYGYFCPGNDSNLLIVFYVQIMPDDFVMQRHR